MLQRFIPLLPEGAKPVNTNIAIFCSQGEITFFNASCAIFKCSEDDQYGIRLAQGILCAANTVRPAQLARALGVNRSTVSRNKAIYEHSGAQALVNEKGNRSAYKLDREKIQTAQSLLKQGLALRKIGEAIGVTKGCIRYTIRKGTLVRESAAKSTENASHKVPSQRCFKDYQSPAGFGCDGQAQRDGAGFFC